MRYKTLTRLLIKLMGLYFIVQGVVYLINVVSGMIIRLLGNGGLDDFSNFELAYLISMLSMAGAGLFLLLASNWITDKLIPSNRPYCPNCGYELTGNTRPNCPECGVNLRGLGLTQED